MVKFMPIWTLTVLPLISIWILPLRYQPREPVANSLTSAVCGTSPITTLMALAWARNSSRVIGQVVFAMIAPEGKDSLSSGGIIPRLIDAARDGGAEAGWETMQYDRESEPAKPQAAWQSSEVL